MRYKVVVTEIDWDVDEPSDLDNLPTELTLEVGVYDDEEEDIDLIVGDFLSNMYCFCHNGFHFQTTLIS